MDGKLRPNDELEARYIGRADEEFPWLRWALDTNQAAHHWLSANQQTDVITDVEGMKTLAILNGEERKVEALTDVLDRLDKYAGTGKGANPSLFSQSASEAVWRSALYGWFPLPGEKYLQQDLVSLVYWLRGAQQPVLNPAALQAAPPVSGVGVQSGTASVPSSVVSPPSNP